MAVRPLPLPGVEQTPSLRYGIARSSKKEHNCPICGRLVVIDTAKATSGMHDRCYVLRQMLKQFTTPPTTPNR